MAVLIGLGAFFCFFEVALGSFFGVLLGTEWTLTTVDKSLVVGAAFVGEMLGSLLLAPLADRFGRRPLFRINLVAYAVLSLATAFRPEPVGVPRPAHAHRGRLGRRTDAVGHLPV
jgi:putative MFS transporter